MIANLAREKDNFRMAVFCEPSVGVVNDKGETGLHITARLNLPALIDEAIRTVRTEGIGQSPNFSGG